MISLKVQLFKNSINHVNAELVTTGTFSKLILLISYLFVTAVTIYYKKLWASMILQFLLLEEIIKELYFDSSLKVRLWNKMKNADLSKTADNYDYEKEFYYNDVK